MKQKKQGTPYKSSPRFKYKTYKDYLVNADQDTLDCLKKLILKDPNGFNFDKNEQGFNDTNMKRKEKKIMFSNKYFDPSIQLLALGL